MSRTLFLFRARVRLAADGAGGQLDHFLHQRSELLLCTLGKGKRSVRGGT